MISTYSWQHRQLSSQLAAISQSTASTYQSALAQESAMLSATLAAIMDNPRLRQAFRDGDRDRLLQAAQPLFEILHRDHDITHFYFITPNRVDFLRVHTPQRFGDPINRHTLQQAEKTGLPAQGLELGVMGTFTLRVVAPCYDGDHLLGYIELGKEIDGITENMEQSLGLSLTTIIDKTLLKRSEWEAGMAMLGRSAQWDHLNRWAVTSSQNRPLPPAITTRLNDWQTIDQRENTSVVTDDGRTVMVDLIPLLDVAKREVGALVLQADISQQVQGFWLSLAMTVLTSALAAAAATIGFYIILTRLERKANLTEEKLRALFQLSPFGLALSRLDGPFVEVNRAFMDMVGYSAEQLATMTDSDLTPLIFAQDDIRHQRILLANQRHGPVQKDYLHQDGHRVPVNVNSMLITGSDGETYCWSMVEDRSERLATTQTLHRQANELARSNAELEAFAYLAAHDLRQPLRSIGGYIGMLQRKYDSLLDDEGRRFIRFAVDGAKQMDRMILDVLDYSRIGRNTHPMTLVDLNDLALNVRDSLQGALDDAQAELVIADGLPRLPAYRSELIRLLKNLIGNAIKYRSPDRSAKIILSASESPDQIILTVQDNGIGIAPEHTDRVFEIFQRLHNREDYDGTGIGLAICRKIAAHHGGRIWVDPAPDHGCCFHVSFPTTPPPNDAITPT